MSSEDKKSTALQSSLRLKKSSGTFFGGCNVEDGGTIAVEDVVDNRAARLSRP